MKIRHFLRDDDISAVEQKQILLAALRLSKEPAAVPQALKGSSIGLLFEKPSLRTRVSCETACVHLGAHPLQLRGEELQLKRGETASDTARVLSGYLQLLLGRVKEHSLLQALAESSSIPIVNGLSDLFHPLQSLADLLTLYQEFGPDLAGKKLVYLGDGNNVCASLALAGVMAGMQVVAASPKRFQLSGSILEELNELASRCGGSFAQTESPRDAVRNANALYTDVWASMGDEGQESDRMATFAAYQLNEELLEQAHPTAIALHCLPAHRNEEISAAVLEGPRSRVFRQAHNRLPATAALFLFLLAPELCGTLARLEAGVKK